MPAARKYAASAATRMSHARARQKPPPAPASYTSEELSAAKPGQALPPGAYLGALPTMPLVARREELRRVMAGVDATMQGQGKLVLLGGEPGVGKTRLAQEVTAVLHQRGFLVTTGRC